MLETEMKKLNSQLEQLNNNFAQFFAASTETAENVATTVINDDQLEQNEAPVITHTTLRDLCMLKVREDKKNKDSVKKILADLGAKIIDDLSEDDLPKAQEKIGAL